MNISLKMPLQLRKEPVGTLNGNQRFWEAWVIFPLGVVFFTGFFCFHAVETKMPLLVFFIVWEKLGRSDGSFGQKQINHAQTPYWINTWIQKLNKSLMFFCDTIYFPLLIVSKFSEWSGIAQSVERSLVEREVSHSNPTNTWSQICGRDQFGGHACHQEVCRCHTRGLMFSEKLRK